MPTERQEKEWPTLLKIAREYKFSKEDTILLLAIRDVENGGNGFEFGIKAARNTNLEEQARWAVGSIRANRKRYQEYLIGEMGYKGSMRPAGISPLPGKEPMDFPEFMGYWGSPTGFGWAPIHGDIPEKERNLNKNWARLVRDRVKKYTKLFKKGVVLDESK